MITKNYRLKSSSIWGYPPRRFFNYLKMIKIKHLPKTLCVLGCSDGRYVIPAAKRGFKVLAMDIDNIALYGGHTIYNNKRMKIQGLLERLKEEKLEKYVEIVNDDFIGYTASSTFSGVFTSGSIQYEVNNYYPPDVIINKIKSYVAKNGILLLEYIHQPSRIISSTRYFTKDQINLFFQKPEWTITSHKVKEYIELPNPRNPIVHKIAWARLYAIRNK